MRLIRGDVFSDNRGTLKSVNDFNMSSILRMYSIEPNFGAIRAWQGHKLETKWFYVVKGSFLVKTMNMETLHVHQYQLSSIEPKVLEITGGNFNGFEALEAGSILTVYSDFDLQKSKSDDFRVGIDQYPW
jgi:dTDP-4-dehydrorhamnose 3,5-epimerase